MRAGAETAGPSKAEAGAETVGPRVADGRSGRAARHAESRHGAAPRETLPATEAPDSVILSPRYLIGAVAAQEPLQQGFVGTIDDVRFYDRSLSDAEVATLFHDTSTPPDQG